MISGKSMIPVREKHVLGGGLNVCVEGDGFLSVIIK